MDYLEMLFDTSGFPARWHCGNWSQLLGWLHIGSDLAIWSAYVAIPASIATLALRRRDLPFPRIMWLFVAFILSCGTTHLNEAVIFWHPIYRAQGVLKLITGLVSWATVLALVPTTRRLLTLHTPEQLEAEVELRTAELQAAQHDLKQAREELEERVAERTRDLERSNRDLEQFMYSASHDLQEPLRMVAGYTELLRDEYGGRLDEEADEYIAFASGGARRMQRLLDDLLAYSRAGRASSDSQWCGLDEAMQDALGALRKAVTETGARIEVDGTLPQVPVPLPLPILSQVFQNLLGNALKFHRAGEAPRVEVSGEQREDRIRVCVRDHGIGFDPAYATRIFSLFRRLHTADHYEGSGMGLAICQRIVERFGGSIWAESQPDEGARFYFELPTEAPNASETA